MTIRLSHATSPNQSTNACVRLIIDHLLPVGVQGATKPLMITARVILRPGPTTSPRPTARGTRRLSSLWDRLLASSIGSGAGRSPGMLTSAERAGSPDVHPAAGDRAVGALLRRSDHRTLHQLKGGATLPRC